MKTLFSILEQLRFDLKNKPTPHPSQCYESCTDDPFTHHVVLRKMTYVSAIQEM